MKNITKVGLIAMAMLIAGCADKSVNVSGEGDSKSGKSSLSSSGSDAVLGSVFFDFDKFNIRADMQGVVDSAAQKLSGQTDVNVVIEGNTDEIGTDEYNYALGTKRAMAVKDALILKGVSKDNVRVVSFGESKPLCNEKTKECHQENRRGDIKLDN